MIEMIQVTIEMIISMIKFDKPNKMIGRWLLILLSLNGNNFALFVQLPNPRTKLRLNRWCWQYLSRESLERECITWSTSRFPGAADGKNFFSHPVIFSSFLLHFSSSPLVIWCPTTPRFLELGTRQKFCMNNRLEEPYLLGLCCCQIWLFTICTL